MTELQKERLKGWSAVRRLATGSRQNSGAYEVVLSSPLWDDPILLGGKRALLPWATLMWVDWDNSPTPKHNWTFMGLSSTPTTRTRGATAYSLRVVNEEEVH